MITKWIFEGTGEHYGHTFVKDKFAIDFHGADPNTSYYCMDCHESVIVEEADEHLPLDDNQERE